MAMWYTVLWFKLYRQSPCFLFPASEMPSFPCHTPFPSQHAFCLPKKTESIPQQCCLQHHQIINIHPNWINPSRLCFYYLNQLSLYYPKRCRPVINASESEFLTFPFLNIYAQGQVTVLHKPFISEKLLLLEKCHPIVLQI